MFQHVAEWTCKCVNCGEVVDVCIRMRTQDGTYTASYMQHDCVRSQDDKRPGTFYIVNAPTLSVLRKERLIYEGYAVLKGE